MRRIFLYLFFLTLAVSQAHAEGAVGFFCGLNLGNLSGDTLPNTSHKGRTGFIAGAFGEIRIAPDVFLGLHPMYVQKGSTITVKPLTEDGDPIKNPLRMDYFAVPVMFKIETGGGSTYFSGGLDLAYLMSAQLTAFGEEIDVENLLSKWDLSIDFAFGGKIPLGSPFLTLELRYSQSLLNVADIQVGEDQRDIPARFRSSGFQVLAGLLFPLGGDQR